MGFIYYLCCCCEAIFDCLTCCFRNKDTRPSLTDLMSATNINEDSQRKKSELELIIVVSSPTSDKKSSPKEKPEHKEFIPRLGVVTPGSFDRLDKRLEKDPEDKTLIQIYQKLSPATISEKISTELCSRIMDRDLKNLKKYLELTKKLMVKKLIEQNELVVILSTCLSFTAESGSTQILQELMSFISGFPKEDQKYILAYPLTLEMAAKKGHTDFIKELTSYFCKIVPDDHRFFEQAKAEAIMKAKNPWDAPKNQEEILKTLGSLKYEVPQKDVIIDLTTALTTATPEPVLSIKEALETSPPTDFHASQESTVDQIGDLEGSSMYVS